MNHTWLDVEDLARDLATVYPSIDPLKLDLAELRDMVVGLESFHDEPEAATDEILEAIQAAWYDRADE